MNYIVKNIFSNNPTENLFELNGTMYSKINSYNEFKFEVIPFHSQN